MNDELPTCYIQDCGGDLRARTCHYQKLLEFVKYLSKQVSKSGWYECYCKDELAHESESLLKEIGEFE